MISKPILYPHHVYDINSMIAGQGRFQRIIQIFHAISSKIDSYTKRGRISKKEVNYGNKWGKPKKYAMFCLILT